MGASVVRREPSLVGVLGGAGPRRARVARLSSVGSDNETIPLWGMKSLEVPYAVRGVGIRPGEEGLATEYGPRRSPPSFPSRESAAAPRNPRNPIDVPFSRLSA
ncbi:hypothetical protein GCM10027168_28880 [Streptomyces capparidis]